MEIKLTLAILSAARTALAMEFVSAMTDANAASATKVSHFFFDCLTHFVHNSDMYIIQIIHITL